MESRLGIISVASPLYKEQHAKGLELLSLMEEALPQKAKRVITAAGRPEYAGSSIDFNISHAKNLVICTMAEGRTGCDIECSSRKVSLGVAEKFFHSEELAFVNEACSEEEKRKRFLSFWVLKEAHIKLLGTSIADLRETPSFQIEKGAVLCSGSSLFYALFEGGGYVLAAAFEKKESRDSLIIEKYGEVPDFTLTAVN